MHANEVHSRPERGEKLCHSFAEVVHRSEAIGESAPPIRTRQLTGFPSGI